MTALIIANTQIRRDDAGRYCLNDLHQASGGEARHRPGRWLDSDKTRELIECIAEGDETAGIPAVCEPLTTHEGRLGGTYAVKELVYAYAMWISAAFHLHVIRAYDAMVTAARADAVPALALAPQHRADQFVSAARIFGAPMRTARTLRMPPAQAIRAAVDCAARNTGVHLADELKVNLAEVVPEPTLRIPTAQAVADYVANRDEVTVPEVAAAVGMPRDHRVTARILTALGWSSRRARRPDGGFYTPWKRVLNA